jgi:hypothetical protein
MGGGGPAEGGCTRTYARISPEEKKEVVYRRTAEA